MTLKALAPSVLRVRQGRVWVTRDATSHWGSEDLVLAPEVRELVRHRRGKIHELTGPRDQAAIDPVSLPRLVPDLQDRDVYVSGPEGFVTDVVEVARALGVPHESIHHEAFAL